MSQRNNKILPAQPACKHQGPSHLHGLSIYGRHKRDMRRSYSGCLGEYPLPHRRSNSDPFSTFHILRNSPGMDEDFDPSLEYPGTDAYPGPTLEYPGDTLEYPGAIEYPGTSSNDPDASDALKYLDPGEFPGSFDYPDDTEYPNTPN